MNRTIQRSILVLAALAAGGCSTLDASWRHYPPKFEPKYVVATPGYQRVSYPNGLQLMVAERHDVPVVSVAVFSKAGSAVDPADQRGLAVVSWETALRAAGGRNWRAMRRAFQSLGATPSLAVGPEGTVLQVTVLKDRYPMALALLADVVRRPALEEEDLDWVRTQVDRLYEDEEVDLRVARRVLARRIFGDHPAGRVAVEPGEYDIRTVRSFHKYYVGPGNTQVVVAGDVAASDVAKRLGGLLGGWDGAAHEPSPPPPPRPHGPEGIVFVPRPGSEEAIIGLAQPVPTPGGPESVAIDAAVGSLYGEIHSQLRYVNGYSYYTAIDHERLPGTHWYYAIAPVPAKHAGDALETIRKNLPEIRKQYDSTRWLEEWGRYLHPRLVRNMPLPINTARITAYGQTVWRLDRVADLARAIGHLYLHDLPQDHYVKEIEAVGNLTELDVKAVIDRYFQLDRFHVVVVGDPEVILPQLRALGPVVQVDDQGTVQQATARAAGGTDADQ